MVLVDVDIAGEEDDWQVKHVTGGEYTAEYNLSNATWAYQRYGTPATDFTGSNVFYLFRGITIPQGSTIDDATLTIPSVEVNGVTPMPLTIRAVNNSAPTNQADYQAYTGTGPAFNTPVLTPVVTFSPTDSVATDYPVDVKAHVQALVDAFDYSNDNMLFRMAKTPVTTTTLNFDAQNFEYQVSPPDTSANLTINYSSGCASDFCEDFNEYARTKLPVPREQFNYSTQALADASWVPQDTPENQVNFVTEKHDYVVKRDGTNVSSTFDLGAGVVSDELWTLRAKVFIDTPLTFTSVLSASASISMSDTDSSTGVGGVNNDIIVALTNSATGGGQAQHVVGDRFEGNVTSIIGSTIPAFSASETIYVELKRLSTTEMQSTIYTDASFSVIRDRITRAISPSLTGLRYIKFGGPKDVTGWNGTMTGTFDNIEFWNEGHQGDQTFEDDFVQKPVTFEDDFTTDNWTNIAGSKVTVNTGTEVIDWSSSVNAVYNEGEFNDIIGEPINTDSWTLRCKLVINTATVGIDTTANDLYIGFSDDNTSVPNGFQDFVGWRYSLNSPSGAIRTLTAEAGQIDRSPEGGGVIYNTSVTTGTFYLETVRSGSNVTGTIYSDANFTQVIESVTETVDVGITGLRYLKVMVGNRDGSGDHTYDGTIDDIEFYNGTSTLTRWLGAIGNDVGLDTVNEIINFDPPTGVERDELVAFDLQTILDGNNASDENWTLRFKINTDTLVQGSSEESSSLLVGLDNNLDSTTTGTHNLILFRTTMDQGGAGPQFGAISSSLFREGGEYFTGGTGGATQFPFAWSTGTLFVELKRLSQTLMETTLFTDSTFRNIATNSSGVPLTVQDTITSTIVDLRYIRVTTESSDVANDTSYDGSIDDIEFYNGVSVPQTPIEKIKDFEDNFWEDDFTDVGTGVIVNTGTQVIDSTSGGVSADNGTYFDFGAGVVSDTEWALRFKVNFSTLTLGAPSANFYVGMSDNNVTMAGVGTQDMISFKTGYHNSVQGMGAFDVDNATVPKGGVDEVDFGTVPLINTDYYVEVARTSDITYIAKLYSDPDFSILIASGTGTCTASTDGLRYLKVAEHSGGTAVITATVDDIQFWNKQRGLDHQNKWRSIDL